MCISVLGIIVIIIKWRILFTDEECNSSRRRASADLPPTYEIAISMPGGKHRNLGLPGGKDQLVFPGKHRARTCSSPNILLDITTTEANRDSRPESGASSPANEDSPTPESETVLPKLQRSHTWGNLQEVQSYSTLNGSGYAKPPSYAFAVKIIPDELFIDKDANDPSPA